MLGQKIFNEYQNTKQAATNANDLQVIKQTELNVDLQTMNTNKTLTLNDLSENEKKSIGICFALKLEETVNKTRIEKSKKLDNKIITKLLIDSGGTSHMINYETPFDAIKRYPIGKIILGDGSSIDALGRQDLTFHLNEGNLRCKGTLFVPKLRENILSVAKLTDSGYDITFSNTSVIIYDKMEHKTITGIRKNNVYYLYPGNLNEVLKSEYEPLKYNFAYTHEESFHLCNNINCEISHNKTNAKDKITAKEKRYKTTRNKIRDINELHRELGHLNFKYIRAMINENPDIGIELNKSKPESECHVCRITKSTADVHPRGHKKAQTAGELIHSDLCGPMRIQTRGGYKYFMTFIDDFSSYCIIRLLTRKSDAKHEFMNAANYFENQFNCTIKRIRHDRGTEYMNTDLHNWCTLKGIKSEPTDGYNPKQNSVAERRNYTYRCMATAMMRTGKMSKKFWGDAILTANYISNRTMHVSNEKHQSPLEMLGKGKPKLSRLATFGCIAYVHIPKELRGKLDDTSITCRFIGYSSEAHQDPNGGSGGFLLFDPKTNKSLTSSDVTFNTSLLYTIPDLTELTINDCINDDEFFELTDLRDHDILPDLEPGSDSDHSQYNDVEYKPKLDISRNQRAKLRPNQNAHDNSSQPEGGSNNKVTKQKRTVKVIIPFKRKTAINTLLNERNLTSNFKPNHDIFETFSRDILPESEHIFIVIDEVGSEPKTLDEAMKSPEWPKWKEAIDNEWNSLISNNTWIELPKSEVPHGRKPIGCKWVLKIKRGSDGEIIKYKARLVAKGFSQRHGIDYNHTFAPTVKLSAVRMLLTIAALEKLQVRHLDIKTAYLYGDLDEEIYMKLPEWYERKQSTESVLQLVRGLYGLKQAGRQWNKKISNSLKEAGFEKSDQEPCIFIKLLDEKHIIIAIFVDDIIIAANNDKLIEEVKNFLALYYQLNDEGELTWYTGIKITRDFNGRRFYLSQPQYIKDMVDTFGLRDAKICDTPMEGGTVDHENMLYDEKDETQREWLRRNPSLYRRGVGTLMFLMVATRPELAFSVSTVSRYLDRHSPTAWKVVKRIMRYLKGTPNYGLILGASEGQDDMTLKAYFDADWAGDLETRKSTSGYIILLNDSAISWKCERQPVVALSTTEAELIATTSGGKEVIALRRLLKDMGHEQVDATTVYEDNQGCIYLMHNDLKNKRTKHIDIKYFWLKQQIDEKKVELLFCPTQEMIADIMTKSLPRESFQKFRSQIRVLDVMKEQETALLSK